MTFQIPMSSGTHAWYILLPISVGMLATILLLIYLSQVFIAHIINRSEGIPHIAVRHQYFRRVALILLIVAVASTLFAIWRGDQAMQEYIRYLRTDKSMDPATSVYIMYHSAKDLFPPLLVGVLLPLAFYLIVNEYDKRK